jgi:hypothetical protein
MAIYRLIVETAPGRVDTGANYPGCSPENPNACDPRQFATLDDAYAYAEQRGEEPYVAGSVEEVWDIVAGRATPRYWYSNPVVLGLGALVLFRFLKR